jgi:hypothetical protein
LSTISRIYRATIVAYKTRFDRCCAPLQESEYGNIEQARENGVIYRDGELGYRVAFCKSIDASRTPAASGAARQRGAPHSIFEPPAARRCRRCARWPSVRLADVTNLLKKAGARCANQT